jgi:hypothetical protein
VEEAVFAHGGEEHVGQSVVVVIADGDAHAVEAHVQAGAGGHVGEAAGAVIAVEGGGRGCLAGRGAVGPVGGVDEEEVGVAVGVEVKEGHAATHRFGQEFVAVRAVVVDEGDAGGGGDVGELHFGNLGQDTLRKRGRREGCVGRRGRGWVAAEEPGRGPERQREDQKRRERAADGPAEDRVGGGGVRLRRMAGGKWQRVEGLWLGFGRHRSDEVSSTTG